MPAGAGWRASRAWPSGRGPPPSSAGGSTGPCRSGPWRARWWAAGTSRRAWAWTPFAPYGLAGVAGAAGVLMFAFVGWEAASHLSAEFAVGRRGRRGLTRATVVTLVVVGVLYLGVSVTSVGVLGADMPGVPLSALLEVGLGGEWRGR
ncbi:amino acid permease [Nonomuraea sp. NPDC049655]|uniref:amino acid permease n=1 Tax=Nonomuraea sp. NPDC049655 TaxID=3364355 RepID=UPI00379EBCA0